MTQQEKQQKSGFVRHFPKINFCFPCCCGSFGTGVKIAVIIITFFCALSVFDDINNTNSNEFSLLSLVIDVIILIIQILLCFGVFNKNVSLFKPFKIVYGIYIIFDIAAVIMFVGFNISLGINEIVNSDLGSEGEGLFIFLLIYIIVFGINIYYYLAVCSYMEDIKEDLYIANQQRDIEENIPDEVRVANKY
eukprot:jgi/Orpsp1_1/1174064/evm.model.c7180000048794.1